MTRDEIIRMAREANLGGIGHRGGFIFFQPGTQGLEHFAALVAAAEREACAQWMMARGYATGHGDSIEDMLQELCWQAKEAEREACAQVCDDIDTEYEGEDVSATWCAAAIRARGE